MKKKNFVFLLLAFIVFIGVYFLFLRDDDKKEKENTLIHEVLPGAETFITVDTVDDDYAVYTGYSDSFISGYAVTLRQEGFRKDIWMVVGIDTTEHVTCVKILEQKETKGKGSRITESEFLAQFSGVDADWSGEVDTIAGASISSTAVADGVLSALSIVKTITE